MSSTQKIIIAIVAAFGAGFLLVGVNKNESPENKEAAAMIRAISNMQTMAHKKCPALVKKHTGGKLDSFVTNKETDNATYLTLEWLGDKDDPYKKVSCTLSVTLGGISKFVIDDEVIIDKDV